MDELLTRDEFKRQVFAKTKGKCCVSESEYDPDWYKKFGDK